jgi:hypothetical protein
LLLLRHLLQRWLRANPADDGVLALLELELESLHARVQHAAEDFVLLVALRHRRVGLDDLLERLQADLGVLAALFHWGLGAGGDLG